MGRIRSPGRGRVAQGAVSVTLAHKTLGMTPQELGMRAEVEVDPPWRNALDFVAGAPTPSAAGDNPAVTL
jgi:hypothetical protein